MPGPPKADAVMTGISYDGAAGSGQSQKQSQVADITMAGRAIAEWWALMKPYAIAYRELWPSLAVTAVLYYKISYGGKKAVKDKSSSPGH
ncbi:hypothetical protein chiPu_0014851 [Chiloscyllium punctatum]|uniref:Uncharacterized protein n=1 Tax=Chiloscyllium punctatum TaxID=137246 RepID=A0A401T165_CHIPU|nr:hypothetical protein [Chiloscyllium punctatum]